MAELTKEHLTQIVRAIDSEAYDEAEIMGWFNSDDIMEMARQLLAGMEQEPVGEVVLGDYDDCGDYPDAKVVCIAAQGQADWNNFRNGTKLYAALQLPQPAVASSNELLSAMEQVLRISDRDHDAWHRARDGIAVFRAVMLQGAEPVQPYTLRDGWVAVPVEPTHAMINAWLSEVANWRGHVAGYKAMLAEAPKRRID